MKGTVRWFSDQKGYGFIGQEGNQPDVFVHFSAIEDPTVKRKTLNEGDQVEFNVVDGPKGRQAANVRKI